MKYKQIHFFNYNTRSCRLIFYLNGQFRPTFHGNFPLESEWDGNFNQHDTLSLNSSSDKVRLKLHVVYKEKPYIQSCDVALTANTMTSIKVVFDAADKLRCETVK